MKNNDIKKKPVKSIQNIDKKILPFFSNPVILKRISDQEKNKNFNPQKKLIFKIIKLNENLVKFTTSIKKYNLNLDSWLFHHNQISAGNKSDFILFLRNNLFYNLKFRLSNILYKIEKFTPILKLNSLLNNINLFAPKRLFKPQPYIRFTFRMIQINNVFNLKKTVNPSINFIASDKAYNSIFSSNINYSSALPSTLLRSSLFFSSPKGSSKAQGEGNTTTLSKGGLRKREKVLIKMNNYKQNIITSSLPQYSNSIIKLQKLENGKSIKYILLKLNNLLNEIDNIINIKNKFLKIIKISNIKNLSNFDNNSSKVTLLRTTYPSESVGVMNVFNKPSIESSISEDNSKPLLLIDNSLSVQQTSNLSVKLLRKKIKKMNSSSTSPTQAASQHPVHSIVEIPSSTTASPSDQQKVENNNMKTYPLLIEGGMVTENKIKMEETLKSILVTPLASPSASDKSTLLTNSAVSENSNPVDLLYFNNNLKKPILNQYLKSMSVYNMITSGAILYYSNIIGFNFKKRVREYLPFIKSMPSASSAMLLQTKVKQGNNAHHQSIHYIREKGIKDFTAGAWGRGIENNKIINNIYKLLYLSFKSMYCLISKPVFIIKSNKIIVQLFYFLLIPKLLKHKKSKTNYKQRNKKKIYKDFVEKKKQQALASLYQTRLKEKEENLLQKAKYLSELASVYAQSYLNKGKDDIAKAGNDNPTEGSIGASYSNFPTYSPYSSEMYNLKKEILQAPNLPRLRRREVYALLRTISEQSSGFSSTYEQALQQLRESEANSNNIKIDKNGKVIKVIQAKMRRNKATIKATNLPQLSITTLTQSPNLPQSYTPSHRGKAQSLPGAGQFLNEVGAQLPNVISVDKFKNVADRMDGSFTHEDLVRFSIAATATQPTASKNKHSKKKIKNNYHIIYKASKFYNKKVISNLWIPAKLRWSNWKKKFNYLAFLYLNNIKTSHPLLDKLNIKHTLLRIKTDIIKEKAKSSFTTLPLNIQHKHILWINNAQSLRSIDTNTMQSNQVQTFKEIDTEQVVNGNSSGSGGNLVRSEQQITKFNSYNRVNSFLFKKFFWNKRLSKIIIPNAKILQKLGIPQWCWPYSNINKKILMLPNHTNNKVVGLGMGIGSRNEGNGLSVAEGNNIWPFSFLISPAAATGSAATHTSFSKDDLWSKEQYSYKEVNTNINNPTPKSNIKKRKVLLKPLVTLSAATQRPVVQPRPRKVNNNKIRELYTKRYHLMKLANINLIKLYPLKFEKLCEVLNSIFNKPVELDLIRLHYPYNDSNILVRILAFMINKVKLRRITRRLFKKAVIKSIKKIDNKDQVNIIPAFLSGMTIKVAGRLMKYKVVPKKTVKIVRRGSSSIGKINYSDFSRYTNKNKRGSFTITIKSGQNFFN